MIREIVVGLLVVLIVGEISTISPWIAVKLARWAPKQIYAGDIERASALTEDLEAHVTRTIPSKLGRLAYALGFGCVAVHHISKRRVTRMRSALLQRRRQQRPLKQRRLRSPVLLGLLVMTISMSSGALISAGWFDSHPTMMSLVVIGTALLTMLALMVSYWPKAHAEAPRESPMTLRRSPPTIDKD
jgi:hypothetical protein